MKSLIALIAVFLSFSCFAADFYVDASQSDANDGLSWATAKQTIQAAVDLASDGDTVWVTNGVYASGGRVAPGLIHPNRVCVTNAVSIRSLNGPEHTFIRGDGDDPYTTYRGVFLKNGASLEGFTVSGCSASLSWEASGGIPGMEMDAMGGGAFLSEDARVDRCIFKENEAGLGAGGGVFVYIDAQLNNCVIADNQNGGVYIEFFGVLNNCTIAGNSFGQWADLEIIAGTTFLNNCIIWGEIAASGDGIFLNSCFSSDWESFHRVGVCIENDPLFVDATNGNYQLLGNSPCIESGTNLYAVGTMDVVGNSRITGDHVDMGAYEAAGKMYRISTMVGQGNGTISPENPLVLEGADVTFHVEPSEGYYASYLLVDYNVFPPSPDMFWVENPDVHTLTNVMKEHSVEVWFEPLSYTLSVNGGSIDGGLNSGSIECDDDVLINAPLMSSEGRFLSWSVQPQQFAGRLDDSFANPVRLTMPATNLTVTANYIDVDSDGDGMDDSWEFMVVNASQVDSITNISQVLPDDDYDGDGVLNLDEAMIGSSPVRSDRLRWMDSSETGTNRHQLVWEKAEGVEYELQCSSNLVEWYTVDGYPQASDQLADAHAVNMTNSHSFYRVVSADLWAPEVLEQYPPDGGFAVSRFGEISVLLADDSGIDPSSVRMTVDGLGTFTLEDSQLSIVDGRLVFDNGGDEALGYYGETVDAEIIVSDYSGNVMTNQWAFELESEPIVATNLFVFGSPDAQRTGQQIGAIPTRILATRVAGGPIRMSASVDAWQIDHVTTNAIAISYTGTNAPVFCSGTYLANLTPVNVDEIFYRVITAVTNDAAQGLLTLFTEDVELTDIIERGSISSADCDLVFSVGGDGVIQKTFSYKDELKVPLAFSLDGSSFGLREDGFKVSLGGDSVPEEWINVDVGDAPIYMSYTAEQLNQSFVPSLRVDFDIDRYCDLSRLEILYRGDYMLNIVMDSEVVLIGRFASAECDVFEIPLGNLRVPLGMIGPVPVWLQVSPTFGLKAEAEGKVKLNFKTGAHLNSFLEFGAKYNELSYPSFEWVRGFEMTAEPEKSTVSLGGEVSLGLSAPLKIGTTICGLAGIATGVEPKAEFVCETDFFSNLSGGIDADVSLVGTPDGPAFKWFDDKELSWKFWSHHWHLFPDISNVEFITQPSSMSLYEGQDAYFACALNQSDGITYQWYRNGWPLFGQKSYELLIRNVNQFHAGEYKVKVRREDDGVVTNSAIAVLDVEELPATKPPVGMVRIPAGTNEGYNPQWTEYTESFGDEVVERDYHDGYPRNYSLTVDNLYMDRYEITNEQWREVYVWAVANGYSFENSGTTGDDNLPVSYVNWYDCVKWCNARSEMEGRNPCYRSGGEVARSGRPVDCDYDADGYRLPTNEEWEYAARGGRRNRMFPWGNIISHRFANYYAFGRYYPHDESDMAHPDYEGGKSSVGTFYPNGYGLYDMVGNVEEWTADQGDSSSYRCFKGGCSWWSIFDSSSRTYVANTADFYADSPDPQRGFRTVRKFVEQ